MSYFSRSQGTPHSSLTWRHRAVSNQVSQRILDRDVNRKCTDIPIVKRVLGFIFPQARFGCRNNANLESRIDLCAAWRCCEMGRLVKFLFRYEVFESDQKHAESHLFLSGYPLTFGWTLSWRGCDTLYKTPSVAWDVVTRIARARLLAVIHRRSPAFNGLTADISLCRGGEASDVWGLWSPETLARSDLQPPRPGVVSVQPPLFIPLGVHHWTYEVYISDICPLTGT